MLTGLAMGLVVGCRPRSGATDATTNPVVSAAPARAAAVLMSMVAAAFALVF
jgi:hypothetical protein